MDDSPKNESFSGFHHPVKSRSHLVSLRDRTEPTLTGACRPLPTVNFPISAHNLRSGAPQPPRLTAITRGWTLTTALADPYERTLTPLPGAVRTTIPSSPYSTVALRNGVVRAHQHYGPLFLKRPGTPLSKVSIILPKLAKVGLTPMQTGPCSWWPNYLSERVVPCVFFSLGRMFVS